MKTIKVNFLMVCIFGSLCLAAQQKKTMGSVARFSPEMDFYVSKGAEIEILAEGFDWAEGPVWVDQLNAVLFSDVPQNKIYRWDEKNGLQLFLEPSGYTGIAPANKKAGSNGLALDANNHLIICMHGDRRVARLNDWEKGGFMTLVNKFDGKYFNSPNDLFFAKNGDLYFTDPPYGLQGFNHDKLKELPYNGVYKLSASGELTLIIDDLSTPNGIAISNDQKTLYVNSSDPNDAKIMAYDITPDGVANGRVFFDGSALVKKDTGLFDGLKVHPTGIIFSTGPGGVLVLKPDGTHLGTIRTEEITANCGFDSKYEYLYMTSDNYFTRIKL